MKGLKTEFTQDITVDELMVLNKTIGITVEINDGQITAIKFEEDN